MGLRGPPDPLRADFSWIGCAAWLCALLGGQAAAHAGSFTTSPPMVPFIGAAVKAGWSMVSRSWSCSSGTSAQRPSPNGWSWGRSGTVAPSSAGSPRVSAACFAPAPLMSGSTCSRWVGGVVQRPFAECRTCSLLLEAYRQFACLAKVPGLLDV